MTIDTTSCSAQVMASLALVLPSAGEGRHPRTFRFCAIRRA